MSDVTTLLLDVFILYAAARIGGELCERLGQPALVGEIIGGIVVGPHALGLTGLEQAHRFLAELGVIVLLFFIGLETPIASILRVGARSGLVALSGMAVTFTLCQLLMAALGRPYMEALFVSAAVSATSIAMTARVLRDMGVLQMNEARIILGAALIDDVIGLMLLSVVSGVAATGQVDPLTAGLVFGQAVAFILFVVLVGVGAVRRYDLHLERLRLENPALSVALLITLGLAATAGRVGLAAVVGAFLAGMVFAEARQQPQIRQQTLPIYQFLAPFFFVVTGTEVDPRLFLDIDLLGLGVAVTAVAIVGKVVGCGLPGWGLGRRSMLIVGAGMVPRGEVVLIVAGLGLRLGAVSGELFNVIVLTTILTALAAPPLLRRLYAA